MTRTGARLAAVFEWTVHFPYAGDAQRSVLKSGGTFSWSEISYRVASLAV